MNIRLLLGKPMYDEAYVNVFWRLWGLAGNCWFFGLSIKYQKENGNG